MSLGTQVYALDWAVVGGMMVGFWDDCVRKWRVQAKPRRTCAALGDCLLVALAASTLLASLFFGNWLALRLYAVVGWGGGYAAYRHLGSPFVSPLLERPLRLMVAGGSFLRRCRPLSKRSRN